MERIKNFISPRARRKKLDMASGDSAGGGKENRSRVFGVTLEQLVARLPREPTSSMGLLSSPVGARVPFVVRRICEYIYKHGLDNVGLFRVSGSVRVVERMRLQFELAGDVDLEGENDVAAVAGLLRVFLRDLPDTLISERLTPRFFSLVQESSLDKATLLGKLKSSLDLLPEENYNLLKYITSLLVVVAENEADNKMSAYSLAILFGPNVFRYELTSGMGGLRDMDSSKEVMQLFISNYGALFAEANEPLPAQFWAKLHRKSTPPPRPPPPKVQSLPSFKSLSFDLDDNNGQLESPRSSTLDYRPVPSPRKIKNVLPSSRSLELEGKEDRHGPTLTLNSDNGGFNIPLFSPRDDIEYNRAPSPFALESETHSIIESPMITARTNEFVEKTIVQTITEHIFGSIDFNQNSGPYSSYKMFDNMDNMEGSLVDPPQAKPRQTVGVSKVVSNQKSTQDSPNKTNGSAKIYQPQDSASFDAVAREDLLSEPKKPAGPPRRMPSRKHRQGSDVDAVDSPLDASSNALSRRRHSHPVSVSNHSQSAGISGRGKENQVQKDDSKDSNSSKAIISCDNSPEPITSVTKGKNEDRTLTPQSQSVLNSQDVTVSPPTPTEGSSGSPTNGIKLFIPPLDFSTLHEHVDGSEPIPVGKGQYDSQIYIKTSDLIDPTDDNVALISPRSNKLKKKNGKEPTSDCVEIEAPMSPSAANTKCSLSRASTNIDVPPSPPIQQDIYKKHSDEDCSFRLKQLTKKISGLKKKIKVFEESFEQQHGYKPSQGERAAQPDIKKHMAELSKARKDLKRLKEATEKGNRSRHNSGASGIEPSPPTTPTVASTLEFIVGCLLDKRKEAGRPEDVVLMNREQVLDEKLCVQRALLHFEGLHGRPSTREEKELMRPLYDRYRSIKRILAKPVSPRNSLELQTVPEDQMIEIPRFFTQKNAIHIPTASISDEVGQVEEDCGTGREFGLVTQDLGLLREIEEEARVAGECQTTAGLLDQLREIEEEDEDEERIKEGEDWRNEDSSRLKEEERNQGGEANLHEMSLVDLHVEIEVSRTKKKKLRRILKEFEDDFYHSHGRKVQKEDRHPLQSEYSQYKKVKARLRLLDALVLKHHD